MTLVYCRHNLRDFKKIKAIVEKINPQRASKIRAIDDPREAIKLAERGGTVVIVSGLYHHNKYSSGDWNFGPDLAKMIKRANPGAIFVLFTSMRDDAIEFYNKNVNAVVNSEELSGCQIIAEIFARKPKKLTLKALKADLPVFQCEIEESGLRRVVPRFPW